MRSATLEDVILDVVVDENVRCRDRVGASLLARIATLCTLIIAVTAAPATAARVSATSGVESDGRTALTTISYDAEPFETNQLQVDPETGRVTDPGSLRMVAGKGCNPVDDHTAVCPVNTDKIALKAMLGTGDDSIRLDKPFSDITSVDAGPGNDTIAGVCYVDAGPGNDTITGCTPSVTTTIDAGSGDDTVVGGPSGDVITGGGGKDVIDGGPGDDYITDGDKTSSPGADQLDGGPGLDEVTSYQERRQPVHVDLSAPFPNGTAGEDDTVRNFEAAVGGYGNDVLIGTAARDRLVGGLGRDRIEGRGGSDDLAGGEGADTIIAGPGNDMIHARDEFRDAIECGPGTDNGSADPADRQTGCESVHPSVRDMIGAFGNAHGAHGALRLHCFDAVALLSCAVRVTLRGKIGGRSRVIGSGACAAVSRCATALKVTLTKPARTVLEHRSLRARATIVRTGDSFGALPQSERVTLVPSKELWGPY